MQDKNDYSYFPALTPRQQLNDLMHKYAQQNALPYGESWAELERRYYKKHGRKLSLMRWDYCRRIGEKTTLPAYLETTGQLPAVLEIGHEMTGRKQTKNKAWQGKAWQGKARQGLARQGTAFIKTKKQ